MLTQIKASAGSGKTYTLTRHFLSLLAGASSYVPLACKQDFAPQGNAEYAMGGILAATFTNKAAAEMKARVIRDLKRAALGQDESLPFTRQEAANWVDTLLRRYDELNIRTIDSLLNMLARAGALALGLPPDFTPVFQDEEYFAPLYDALLDKISAGDGELRSLTSEACRALLLHSNFKGFLAGDSVRKTLRELLRFSLREQEEIPLPDQAAIQRRLQNLGDDLRRAAGDLLRLLEEEGLQTNRTFRTWLELCADEGGKDPPRESSFAGKSCLDECLNKGSRGQASGAANQAFAAFLDAEKSLRMEAVPLSYALTLAPFVALARPLACELARIREEQGLIPAELIPGLAREVLCGENGVSESFCRLSNRLTHLLFDEFQDTSRAQWASILPLTQECLAHGGSLCYVGDVKQAIYGWRGGDAALFDEVAAERDLTALLEEAPRRIALEENWRSAPVLVEFNNKIFAPLADAARAAELLACLLPAGTPAGLLEEGASSLARSFAGAAQRIPATKQGNALPGRIRLSRIRGVNNEELHAQIREKLVQLLRGDLLRRKKPGEIAILVRRNREAFEVASWLAEEQIPVVTEHSFLLDSHPLIRRLLSLLSFLEYPADDASFWAFISGPELFLPVSGLSHAELLSWLTVVRGENVSSGAAPLYVLFREHFPRIWESWLAPFHSRAGLMSAYDSISEIIRCYDLQARLPAQSPFLRRFLEVADAAERSGHSSLSAFLEFWSARGREEKVPMPENMDAVRILTMHKAKGLEFPVVIVPFQQHGAARSADLLLAELGGLKILTRRTKELGAPYYLDRLRMALEQINLLYVAWTRPSEELHAYITGTRLSPGAALDKLLAELPFANGEYAAGALPPDVPLSGILPEELVAAPATADADQDGEPDQAGIPEQKDLIPPFIPMDWLPRLKIFRNPLGEMRFTEKRRGMLAHACLELLRPGGKPEADAQRAVDAALRSFPLPLEDPESVRSTMITMLSWFLSLPDAAAWLAKGRPEQSILAGDGRLLRVDLLVDQGEDGLLILEYKTGRKNPAHQEQLLRYLDLLEDAARRKARGLLIYLDLREIVTVSRGQT